MRTSLVAALGSCLALIVAWQAGAQEETATTARVAVPEAGIAVSFPDDWAVDIEMRAREDWGLAERYADAAPLMAWNVLYASQDGRPWCDVTWYPHHPMTLEELADEYERSMTPTGTDVERTIERAPVTLGLGEAVRVVVYNTPTADHTTVYLFGAGDSRYLLRCVSDLRAEDDWLAVVETVELLPVAEASPSPGL